MRKTNPLKIAEIEKFANKLRKEIGISPLARFPILDVLEKFHEEGLLSVQYMEDNNPIFDDDTPAKYNPKDNFIYIKESVLEELECHEYRSNFTLAHELFHYFQCKIFGFEFEEVNECPSFTNPEWQANEFAGELLIPTAYILGDCDIKKIADNLNVSEHCVITRKLYFERRNKRKM